MSIILLGGEDDSQVTALAAELEARGVTPDIWDSSHWPGEYELTLEQVDETVRITVGDNQYSTDDIDSLFIRDRGFNVLTEKYADELEERPYSLFMQVREYKGLVGAVLTTLHREGVPVVNPPNDRITDKPSQIALFAAHGLPVPETTTTNTAKAAKEFVGSVDEAIYKPTVGGGHADTLEADDLDGKRGEKLSNSPVQFQERADGKNIRVFVLDGAVIGVAHVITEEVDYRSSDHEVEQTTVDPAIEEAAIEATELLDWTFSAVDVMYDEDEGDFVLLEANSSPMFAGFDEHGGLDVAGHLAEYLINER